MTTSKTAKARRGQVKSAGTARRSPAGRPARAGGRRGASSDPVFVLCAGRSGSTLLRFVLDAHPDLACPPETNVPALCGQLANVWALIEGAPLSANRGDEPPEIPDAVIAGVRETMDRMVGSYLKRRGKKRYCDKSLGTARFAYLMSRLWPEAKFICLVRHPMDVIASGIEACPWGLGGYGFDPYISETPSNSVFALARFWVENVSTILAAEEEYADRCHRVRYEDLVSDPQATADALFGFLGVAPEPGIAEKIFAAERERFGPADYKIWNTSEISTDSVGRGWTVPAGLIGPQFLEAMNELCGRLGYLAVDGQWGTADRPDDLRVPIRLVETEEGDESGEGDQLAAVEPAAEEPAAGAQTPSADDHAGAAKVAAAEVAPVENPDLAPLLIERLRDGVTRMSDTFTQRWEPCGTESFLIVATPQDDHGPGARWRVDLTSRSIAPANGYHQPAPASGGNGAAAAEDEDNGTNWDIVGPAEAWEQILAGRMNLSVALRRNQLRYCEEEEAGPIVAETRAGMLADLLGLASWGQARPQASRAKPRGQAGRAPAHAGR
jgi:Sulfotransferase family